MRPIKKINVSEISAINPFDSQDPSALAPGTLTLYKESWSDTAKWHLRLHDGVTHGGSPVGFDVDGRINKSTGLVIDTARGTLAIGTDMETPGVPQHFHIGFENSNTSAPYNDLFLGDDFNAVQIHGTDGAPYYGVRIRANDRNGGAQQEWQFNVDGSVKFPTLTVDLHNGGNQQGQVLQFSDPNQQAIITGPAPAQSGYNAQRLIIQGQNGGEGEGGDVYLWAGDSYTNGGDIKIYAGDADAVPGNGGYINIDAGNGYAQGGNLTLTAGNSALQGGFISIRPGSASQGTSGDVRIITADGTREWNFDNTGALTVPGAIKQGLQQIKLDDNARTITLQTGWTHPTYGDQIHTWVFNQNGYATLPGGTAQIVGQQDSISISSDGFNNGFNGIDIGTNAYTSIKNRGYVEIQPNCGVSPTIFRFNTDGSLRFPNDTTQTTAWTGSVSINDLTGVDFSTAPVAGKVLTFNGTNWVPASSSGGGGGGISLSDISVTVASAGSSNLTYNNVSGVLTYTPPDLSSYVTSSTLSTTLGNYATTSSLSNYVTSSSLSTTLGSYVTSSTLSTTLSSYATQSYVTSQNYITTGSLSVTTNSASGSGSLSYSNGVFTFTPAVSYTLPTASGSTLGGVKVGAGLSVDGSGVLSTTYTSNQNTSSTSNVTFNNITTTGQIVETFNAYSTAISSGATVTLNCTTGNLWNITGTVSGNWTAAATNVAITTGQSTSITLILNQGATAYIPNALSINGTTVSVNWQGGTPPTGSANKKDIVSFSALQTGANTYLVFGQMVTFG